MPIIPRGSIVFSGYGDFKLRFISPAGTIHPRPTGSPYLGLSGEQSGCNGFRAFPTASDGYVALTTYNVGGGDKNGVALSTSVLVFRGGPASQQAGSGNSGMTMDAAGNVYAAKSFFIGIGSVYWTVYKFSSAGAVLASWALPVTFEPGSNLEGLGVNADGTILYYSLSHDGAGNNVGNKIFHHDLTGNTDLGVFVTNGSASARRNRAILVLSGGDVVVGWGVGASAPTASVKSYNSGGTQILEYTGLIDYESAVSIVPYVDTTQSPSPDDETRLVVTYNIASSPGAGLYGVTATLVRTADGVVASSVALPTISESAKDGVVDDFEWDGPACVTRTDFTYILPPPTIPVPLPTPGASQTPCTPQSQVSNGGIGAAGCNTGGIGWVSDGYNGPFSAWVDHADPSTGETLTGKTQLDVWFELTHTAPDGGVDDPLKRAMVELADPDDRKSVGLRAVGDIEHGLGNPQGAFEAASVDIEYADQTDRLFRGLLEDKELENDEVVVYAASPAYRVSNPHVMARSLVMKPVLKSPMSAIITAVDPLFAEFGPFGPDKKWPPTFADIGAGLPGITPDTQAQAIPVLYGQKTDKGATDPIDGHLQEKGVVPGYFCGWFDLGDITTPSTPGKTLEAVVAELQTSVTNGTCVADWGSIIGDDDAAKLQSMGTVPTTYDSLAQVIGYGDLNTLMAQGDTAYGGATTWGFIAFGLGEMFRYIQVFGSNLGNGDPKAQPDRAELDMDARSDLLVPGHIWPFATNYREFTNPDTGKVYWLSGIYVRGPLLSDHLHGVVNITANMWGRMGPDGLPITDVHQAQQHWIENDLLSDWTSGPYADATTHPKWNDGTAKVNSNSFKNRQAVTTVIGGRGLTVSWYVNAQQNLSSWFQEWNDSTETFLGESGTGQVMIWGLNPFESTTTWPTVRHITDIFGPVTHTSGNNRENVVSGQCDIDGDANKFRSGVFTLPNQQAIRAYKDHRKLGNPINSSILNDSTQFGYVLLMRGARLGYGMTMVEFTGGIGLWDYGVGTGIKLTTIEGTGPYGYINRLLIIMRRRFSFGSRLVTLTCWDVDTNGAGVPIIIPPARQFIITAGPSGPALTNSSSTSLVLTS